MSSIFKLTAVWVDLLGGLLILITKVEALNDPSALCRVQSFYQSDVRTYSTVVPL